MRDFKRIDKILKAIQRHWKANPDLRLGQFLLNELDPSEYNIGKLFYLEDDLLLNKLLSKPVIDYKGNKTWYNEDGQLHRLNGPAYEGANGSKEWYQNGLAHRLDGPSIELVNGDKYWHIEGGFYTEEEFNKKTKGA